MTHVHGLCKHVHVSFHRSCALMDTKNVHAYLHTNTHRHAYACIDTHLHLYITRIRKSASTCTNARGSVIFLWRNKNIHVRARIRTRARAEAFVKLEHARSWRTRVYDVVCAHRTSMLRYVRWVCYFIGKNVCTCAQTHMHVRRSHWLHSREGNVNLCFTYRQSFAFFFFFVHTYQSSHVHTLCSCTRAFTCNYTCARAQAFAKVNIHTRARMLACARTRAYVWIKELARKCTNLHFQHADTELRL